MPTTWIRVRDKSTDIEFDISLRAYEANPDGYVRVNAPKQYPDLSGATARPRPEKTRTDKAGQPATTQKES